MDNRRIISWHIQNSNPQKTLEMDFKEKIDAICRAKKMSVGRLAKVSGMGSTVEKAYRENREPLPATIAKFLEAVKVSEVWFYEGEGEILTEKPILRGATKPGDALRVIDIGHPEYILLHRKAFDALEETLAQYRTIQDRNEMKYLELIEANLALQKSYQELEKTFRDLMKVKGDQKV